MSKLVCLGTFASREQANMAKSTLEANGINAAVSADDAGGARPDVGFTSGGAKLFVLDEDVARAIKILDYDTKPANHDVAAGDCADQDVTFPCEECGLPISFPADRRGRVETCPSCHAYVDVPE